MAHVFDEYHIDSDEPILCQHNRVAGACDECTDEFHAWARQQNVNVLRERKPAKAEKRGKQDERLR